MKISSILIISLAVILLIGESLSLKITTTLENKNSNNKNQVDYSTDSPIIIAEMFKKIKKVNLAESKIYDECMKLIINTKYQEGMKKIWNNINNIACSPEKILKHEYFHEFIKSTVEKVKVDNYEKECTPIVETNLLPGSQLESAEKQKELRGLFLQLFTCKTNSSTGKNIITAFLNVHRGSSSTNLYKILNGN